jgi:hypothetical protein
MISIIKASPRLGGGPKPIGSKELNEKGSEIFSEQENSFKKRSARFNQPRRPYISFSIPALTAS